MRKLLLGFLGLNRCEPPSGERAEPSMPAAELPTSLAACCHREDEAATDCDMLWIDLGVEG
jgi:hypothetical protein